MNLLAALWTEGSEGVDEKKFYFCVAFLNQSIGYWVP